MESRFVHAYPGLGALLVKELEHTKTIELQSQEKIRGSKMNRAPYMHMQII